MSGGIFISYRRDDARWPAGRLADSLEAAFGSHNIFRDIDQIDPGLDFAEVLEQHLASCAVMLALIGPRWVDIRDADNQRRLDNNDDWIRQEIAVALKRNIRVIPVLLDDTVLPKADQLPPDIQALVRRQTAELSDARFDADVQKLITALRKIPGLASRANPAPQPDLSPSTTARSSRWKWYASIAAAVAGIIVGVASLSDNNDASDNAFKVRYAENAPPLAGTQPGVAAAVPQSTPDISGLWRTNSGESYDFDQDGHKIDLEVSMNGQQVGSGKASLVGNILRVTLTMPVWGVPVTSNCNLQAAPDWQSFTGFCQNPSGNSPAHIFR